MYQNIRARKTTRELYADAAGRRGRDRRRRGARRWSTATATRSDAGDVTTELAQGRARRATRVDWSPVPARQAVRSRSTPASSARRWTRWPTRINTLPAERHAAPARRQDLRRPPQDGSRRAGAWTGASPRTWPTPRCWPEGYNLRLVGQDCRPRHLLPSPRGPARPERPATTTCRCAQLVDASPKHVTIIDSLLSEEAVMALRIRLRHRRPEHADDLGRPVRRFRQRRPGGDRPVHHLRRGQVGPPVRPGAVPAARLRRPGPGAQLGAPGALPAAVRARQHAGLRAHHAGADVPHAAPADAARARASRWW